MATPTKAELIEQLTKLHVEVPVDASSKQLQDLVKLVKKLPAAPPGSQRAKPAAPLPASTPPPLVAPRPLASRPATPVVSHAHVPPMAIGSGRAVAVVPSPGPTSDHDARPWDPHAGW